MLRALRRAIDTERLVLALRDGRPAAVPPAGRGRLGRPRWLDTSTLRGRWVTVGDALSGRYIQGAAIDSYDAAETPEQAVATALAFWGNPPHAARPSPRSTTLRRDLPARRRWPSWQQHQYRGMRQNALRQLIAVLPRPPDG